MAIIAEDQVNPLMTLDSAYLARVKVGWFDGVISEPTNRLMAGITLVFNVDHALWTVTFAMQVLTIKIAIEKRSAVYCY